MTVADRWKNPDFVGESCRRHFHFPAARVNKCSKLNDRLAGQRKKRFGEWFFGSG